MLDFTDTPDEKVFNKHILRGVTRTYFSVEGLVKQELFQVFIPSSKLHRDRNKYNPHQNKVECKRRKCP